VSPPVPPSMRRASCHTPAAGNDIQPRRMGRLRSPRDQFEPRCNASPLTSRLREVASCITLLHCCAADEPVTRAAAVQLFHPRMAWGRGSRPGTFTGGSSPQDQSTQERLVEALSGQALFCSEVNAFHSPEGLARPMGTRRRRGSSARRHPWPSRRPRCRRDRSRSVAPRRRSRAGRFPLCPNPSR
jgi:hypothetical protein